MTQSQRWRKDPSDILLYLFDFAALTNGNGTSDFLASEETILSATVTATPDDLTIEEVTRINEETSVRFRVSGGTAGKHYRVTCEILTTEGNRFQRTRRLEVIER